MQGLFLVLSSQLYHHYHTQLHQKTWHLFFQFCSSVLYLPLNFSYFDDLNYLVPPRKFAYNPKPVCEDLPLTIKSSCFQLHPTLQAPQLHEARTSSPQFLFGYPGQR
ncbi:hypothetical protein V8G54_025676 [Vigna mungo]|uniref:Uncharacterized protein n=1 Tax=Vigna mungo TaxID=3915 RepID=A0AAQ3MYQ3_VIGMU